MSNQQESITIADVFSELQKKINKVNDYNRKSKTAIFKEYAARLEEYMPVKMIRYELMRKFDGDKNIIKYALADQKYIDLTIEKSTSRLDSPIETDSKNEEKNIIDKEVEKDAKVIKLKGQIKELKERLEVAEGPKSIRIPRNIKEKIGVLVDVDDATIIISDNYIAAILDHDPTPEEVQKYGGKR